VSLSIGVDVGSTGTTSADDLVRNADFAMYGAKALGKGRQRVYRAADREAADDGARIRSELQQAVAGDELRLHYQPIVDLASGAIQSVEALVRWQHPRRGLLLPAAFVPIAEETGAIAGIGAWVLESACRQLRVWQRLRPDLEVSVNLSGAQLQGDALVGQVAATLAATGIAPEALTLEVTETMLVADPGAVAVLERLKGLGVRVAIDDFGTGYASISYLRRFPVDILKIDREFTDDLETADAAALLGGIVHLGRSLGLTIIAEGIERPTQLVRIREAGCDLGQGYLFAIPGDAASITSRLAGAAGVLPSARNDPEHRAGMGTRRSTPAVARTQGEGVRS
jgi:EAL domain-containing protein (putative c-di-GMP-specific phosphodiesterase class I)